MLSHRLHHGQWLWNDEWLVLLCPLYILHTANASQQMLKKKCEKRKKRRNNTHGRIIIMIIAIHVAYLLLRSVKHTHTDTDTHRIHPLRSIYDRTEWNYDWVCAQANRLCMRQECRIEIGIELYGTPCEYECVRVKEAASECKVERRR